MPADDWDPQGARASAGPITTMSMFDTAIWMIDIENIVVTKKIAQPHYLI